MKLKSWLFSNMFVRNMLADFGERSAYSKTPGGFIPYFQYRVGSYKPDYYLYFPGEPYALRYQNEIFNKLGEYKGYDITTFLQFHYSAYKDKHKFLSFLHFELGDRLKRKCKESYRTKLQSALEWVTQMQNELDLRQQAGLKKGIKVGVQDIINPDPVTHPGAVVESSVLEVSRKLSSHVDKLMTDTEERLEAVTGMLPSGRIELTNQNHPEKLIQLFILLQTVQAPACIARGEQLFTRFSATDIAAILQLHFSAFKGLKVNTLQGKVREAGEALKLTDPKVQGLNKALQDFFYEVKASN